MAPLEGILFKTTVNAQGKPHTVSLNFNVKTVMKGKVLLYEENLHLKPNKPLII